MITMNDLLEISGKKMANDFLKSAVRGNCHPFAAEGICSAIDGHERAEHFLRFVKEYNEWMVNQQRTRLFIWQNLLRRGY